MYSTALSVTCDTQQVWRPTCALLTIVRITGGPCSPVVVVTTTWLAYFTIPQVKQPPTRCAELDVTAAQR